MLLNLAYAVGKYGASRPDVKYYCDISYDPFLLLQRENKVYGENISLSIRFCLDWKLIFIYRLYNIAL